MAANHTEIQSMPPRLHEVSQDGLLAELPAGFQAVQAFDQHQAGAVLPNENRNLLADLQDAFGDFLRFFQIERPSPFRGHIDLGDWKSLTLHHEQTSGNCRATTRARKGHIKALLNGSQSMSKSVVVSIPHRLGREEAARRIKSGFATMRANYSAFVTIHDESWEGDRLAFNVSALGQNAPGMLDVADDHVRVEVTLPWLLAVVAEKVTPAIRKETTLMLEKK
jgi:Putative polyhydroxyalkanoic acid system protein (PHA_gran_rgn)